MQHLVVINRFDAIVASAFGWKGDATDTAIVAMEVMSEIAVS